MRRSLLAYALALPLALTPRTGACADTPVVAALHVHSDLSTGEYSLDELATMAERQGLDALLLTENYLLRIEYGLPPFRALTRVAYEDRSVMTGGAARYLARVAEVRARFPRLVIVPGVEVIPHYWWSGSPVAQAMTLHDTQKNLLVFGITDPARLGAIPAIGVHAGRFGLQSVLDLIPALLVVPAVWLVSVKRERRVRIGRAFVVIRSRRWLQGGLLWAVGMIALVRGWPFTVDRYPFWQDAGLAPHQEVIDRVRRAGGVSVWSFPEARDAGARDVGPVRVSWHTDPYADDLLRTARYTAFGAVYEDTTRFELPGEGWDRLLRQYAAGERRDPVWAVGESGFHGPEAGKTLGGVQTVFLVHERSEAGVLEAFRQGRVYARLAPASGALGLGEFSVRADSRVAESGQTLVTTPGSTIEVKVAVDWARGDGQPIRARLVKNGSIVELWNGTAPFRAVHTEAWDGTPAYFRLDASGTATGNRLLSNPVFVRPER